MIIGIFCLVIIGFCVWTPGEMVLNNKKNFQENGIWLSHGWLGDKKWFRDNNRNESDYGRDQMMLLKTRINPLRVRYVFPHLCPASAKGVVPKFDNDKLTAFRSVFSECLIIPWVGGSTNATVDLENEVWTENFVKSIKEVLSNENIDGIHLNIEPLESGNPNLIKLLRKINEIKGGKILSIAAYPPPTIWHPHKEVHWNDDYYRDVSCLVDQVVPMMYDTALRSEKIFTKLIFDWTKEVIQNSNNKCVLFGVPAYEDDVDYHHADVENVDSSMRGIVSGINASGSHQEFGISVYAEWTLDDNEINKMAGFIPSLNYPPN
jgi:hypothetical protein